MIKLGYQFVTVSSDFRSMSTHAQNIVNEMKNNMKKGKSIKFKLLKYIYIFFNTLINFSTSSRVL